MQKQVEQLQEVPSLYVRVYRQCLCGFANFFSSLIICEGISPKDVVIDIEALFPHYM